MKCEYCGKEFNPIRFNQRFCSPHHRIAVSKIRNTVKAKEENVESFQKGIYEGIRLCAEIVAFDFSCSDCPVGCSQEDRKYGGCAKKIEEYFTDQIGEI